MKKSVVFHAEDRYNIIINKDSDDNTISICATKVAFVYVKTIKRKFFSSNQFYIHFFPRQIHSMVLTLVLARFFKSHPPRSYIIFFSLPKNP